MQEGQKYRVRYRIEGIHKVMREGVAAFLAYHADTDELIFSGRPQFGTTQMKPEWIHAMWEVERSEKCYMDRKLKPETRVY
jgi:hypothetical protein